MSEVARDLLARARTASVARKSRSFRHGIPAMDRDADQQALKAKFGVRDRRLLLTFGLLSANKGIETVIRALPAVVRRFPDLVYFVVGATHPAVLRRDGEAYRTMLEREAEKLGVREHVVFRGRIRDIRGAAAVSASRRHLREPILERGAGDERCIVVRDGRRRGRRVDAVLACPGIARGRARPPVPLQRRHRAEPRAAGSARLAGELHTVREAAFTFAYSMAWPRIGDAYVELIRATLRAALQRHAAGAPREPAAREQPAGALAGSPTANDRRHGRHPACRRTAYPLAAGATASTTTRAR